VSEHPKCRYEDRPASDPLRAEQGNRRRDVRAVGKVSQAFVIGVLREVGSRNWVTLGNWRRLAPARKYPPICTLVVIGG
jgi:hypothetical protein